MMADVVTHIRMCLFKNMYRNIYIPFPPKQNVIRLIFCGQDHLFHHGEDALWDEDGG